MTSFRVVLYPAGRQHRRCKFIFILLVILYCTEMAYYYHTPGSFLYLPGRQVRNFLSCADFCCLSSAQNARQPAAVSASTLYTTRSISELYSDLSRLTSIQWLNTAKYFSHPTAKLHHRGAYQLFSQMLAHVVAQVQSRLPDNRAGPASPREDGCKLLAVFPGLSQVQRHAIELPHIYEYEYV